SHGHGCRLDPLLSYFLDRPGAASRSCRFFFFNDTATTEIYTLSLHDALPISGFKITLDLLGRQHIVESVVQRAQRSEEHTSELQSRSDLVCRLLLEKKKE